MGKKLGDMSIQEQNKFFKLIGVLILAIIIVLTVAIISGSKNDNRNSTTAAHEKIAPEPTDLKQFLEWTVNKNCNKVNNLKKKSYRDGLITESNSILININAGDGLTINDTKNKMLENTLNILKDIRYKNFNEITIAYFLPLKDNNTLKTADEQAFTITFEKNKVVTANLDKMDYIDIPNIAKTVVIHPALKK